VPYLRRVLEYSHISISSGAYSRLPLSAALLRIAEIAPAAEICSWGLHSLIEPVNARAVDLSGLPFSVHAPFTHDHLGSRSASKRRLAIDLHERHMAAAAALGAQCYVVHPDLQRRQKARSARTAAALERSFEELRRLQDEFELRVLVENMPFPRRSHFLAPNDLDLKGLGFTLDVGHAAITGTLDDWLATPPGTITHVHLHDNQGPSHGDLHQALGSGIVDAAPAMAAAQASGAMVVLEHIDEDAVLASLRHLRECGLLAGRHS
jgi:sugar phosphate isomerase/epimerase